MNKMICSPKRHAKLRFKRGVEGVGGQTAIIAVLAICVLMVLLPIYVTLMYSFKSDVDLLTTSVLSPPRIFLFSNWAVGMSTVYLNMLNSVVVCLICAVGSTLISMIAAYTFVHFDFPGKEVLFSLIIAMMIIPSILTLTPQYLLIEKLGLKNTWFALILPYISGGLVGTIFLLRTFLQGQPKDIFEAGKIDGASHPTLLFRIALPLAFPIILINFVGLFGGWYNDYIWPILVIDSEKLQMLMPRIKILAEGVTGNGQQQGAGYAMYLLSGIPLMLIAAFSMRHMVSGEIGAGLKM